jgi:hypothetical protein
MPSKASTSPPFRRETQLKLVTPSDSRDELGMGKETFVTRPVQRFHESPETAYRFVGLGAPLKDEQPPSPNAEKQEPKTGQLTIKRQVLLLPRVQSRPGIYILINGSWSDALLERPLASAWGCGGGSSQRCW